MYRALAVANYFIQAALDSGIARRDFPAAKVHGLVFLAHGWMLGSTGRGIIAGPVMADPSGVFIPELREVGCSGTRNVTALASVIETDAGRGVMIERIPQLKREETVAAALAWIWQQYGAMPSFQIAQEIRAPGGPWDQAWNSPNRRDLQPRAVPDAAMAAWFGARGLRRHA